VASWTNDNQKTIADVFNECKDLLVQLAHGLMDEKLRDELHENLVIPVVPPQTVEAVLENEGMKIK
jgi:hypothetical protein